MGISRDFDRDLIFVSAALRLWDGHSCAAAVSRLVHVVSLQGQFDFDCDWGAISTAQAALEPYISADLQCAHDAE